MDPKFDSDSYIASLVCLHLLLLFRWRCHNVQDIVAPDQYFTQVPRKLSVQKFFRVAQLQVHVRIGALELALVLHPPL